MNPFTAYRLHITPLSPIHIGTGESYEPTNYVIEDGALHEFDTGAAMAALSPKDREELLKIASGKPDTQMLKALQSFFYERKQLLQAHAVNVIPVLPGIAQLYAQRIGQAANQEKSGKHVINKLEIDRTAFNPLTRLPLLYGSSIKGAIRTALLDSVNRGSATRANRGLHDFQGPLLGYSDPQTRRLHLELDPMRLVHLADAAWQGGEGLPAAEVYLAVNRKKHPVRDEKGQLRQSQAEKANGGEGLYQILECIPGWHFRAFTGQLNLHQLGNLPEIDGKGQKVLPSKALRFDIQQIAQACNRFYLPILNKERKILSEQRYIDAHWNNSLQNALALAQDRIKQGRAFLLRIGRHSGAESVTLNGARNGQIKIMKGKGQQPDFGNEAKTLWLAADEVKKANNLLPFGWLLVEVSSLDQPTEDWEALREVCEPNLGKARLFASTQEQKRETLAKTRQDIEARREADERLAHQHQQAEIAALQAQAERQAKLAAMSEQAQQVEAFRERMEREGVTQWANAGNGGPWFSDLKKLAESASQWNSDDKARLLELIQYMGLQEPRLAPKKNEGMKKLIKSLSA